MKKIAVSLIAMFAITAALATAGPALGGDPTPIGIAEAKSAAKKFLHGYCRDHNCRGSRVKDCVSKTPYRVDCDGIYGRGRKDICTFKISVANVGEQTLRITIIQNSVDCTDN
jgi:hypothetical protein